jgi:hypothetical protein
MKWEMSCHTTWIPLKHGVIMFGSISISNVVIAFTFWDGEVVTSISMPQGYGKY